MDGSDRPLEPSERTITDDTHSTAYRKYLGVHTVLNAPLSSPMGETLKAVVSSFLEEAYTLHTRKATNEQYVFRRSVGVEREQERDTWILSTRGKVGGSPKTPWFAELISRLHALGPEFRRLWSEHEVLHQRLEGKEQSSLQINNHLRQNAYRSINLIGGGKTEGKAQVVRAIGRIDEEPFTCRQQYPFLERQAFYVLSKNML
jgi:hypothetical protein